jgi:hypothetical protein
MKVVGVQEFTATARRPDRPAEIHEARWRTHERVKVRRPGCKRNVAPTWSRPDQVLVSEDAHPFQ